jgi:hypothetical protein
MEVSRSAVSGSSNAVLTHEVIATASAAATDVNADGERYRAGTAIDADECRTAHCNVTAIPSRVRVVKSVGAVNHTVGPSIRTTDEHVSGPWSIQIEVIKNFDFASPVEVDCHDLIGTVHIESKFGMAHALIVGVLVIGGQFLVTLVGKVVESGVQVGALLVRVGPVGYRFVERVLIRRNLIGVVLFDPLPLLDVGVLVGTDPKDVSRPDQEVNALGVCNRGSCAKEQRS